VRVNAYDTLLQWASELGEGTWENWKTACADLGVEPNQAARGLSALGHLEFDWAANRFNCAPPTAVLTLHSSGCVLITGARRRGQREALEALYEQNPDISVELLPPISQPTGPATWLVEADLTDVGEYCELAGMRFEIDSGRRIAQAMPEATLEAVGERERPDGRFPRRWFDPHRRILYPERPGGGEEGLWWVEEYRREVAFVHHHGQWFRVSTREYGPFLAYPEVAFMTYQSTLGFLTVDNKAPLPPLLARAATLQSGRLPYSEGAARHTYVNIDEELAKLIQDRLSSSMDWR
jgi:hypothetical protein